MSGVHLCLEASLRRARLVPPALVAAGTSLVLAASAFATATPAAAGPADPTAATVTAKTAASGGAGGGASAAGNPAPAQITLITGDQVLISNHNGRQAVTTKAADRGPGTAPVSFSTFVLRGDTYVAPSDAAAYIGAPLDWSLFDVSALARAGITNGAALPVTVGFTSGAAHRALPGIVAAGAATATRSPMKQAPASAATFGAALATQLQHDAARAHGQPVPDSAGGGLFDGIRSIALDSARAAAKDPTPGGDGRPDPGFNMQTLTLNAIGRDGAAPSQAFGDAGMYIVEDVDDPAGFAAEIPMLGTQKWSVPAGNYDIRAYVLTWFQKTITFITDSGPIKETVWDSSMSFVWHPQVPVQHDTTVTSDARTAKEIAIPTTPDGDTTSGFRTDPAGCCDPEFELASDHASPNGQDIPFYWQSGAHDLDGDVVGLSAYATPSDDQVTDGTRRFYTYFRLGSPSSGHIYDLVYPTSGGVPSSYATSAPAADLASIPTTYASELPGRVGSQVRFGYQPWETLSVRAANPITEPLNRTEYVLASGAATDTLWQESPIMSSDLNYPVGDAFFGPYTRYRPGPQPAVAWFGGPSRPGAEEPGSVVQPGDTAAGAMVCPVCRDADTLSFGLKPYVDGPSDEWADGLDTGNQRTGTHIADSESLDWYVDGALAAQHTTATDPGLGNAQVALPAASKPATYRIDYRVSRDTPWSSLSTQTDTRWDFASGRPKRPGTLPAGWSCGTLTGKCAVVPLLLLDYRLPLDEHDAVPAPGTVSFTVHVYHQPQSASTARIDLPSVSTSIDDGASWQPATDVSALGNGNFRVSIATPDPASVTGFVSLKVRDTDSSGAGVRQTIIRAFTLAGSAASRGAGIGTAPPPSGDPGPFADSTAVCPTAAAGQASCDAFVRTMADGQFAVTPAGAHRTPPGYGPADLASAYDLPRTGGADQTVAVVDAAGDPNIVADVAAYRAQYGLPACTADDGCLRVVNQDGSGPPPSGGFQSWGVETALDMDMVSAACPQCRLLLVVANTPSIDDLAQAERTAAGLGADVISNSYGSYEQEGIQDFADAYQLAGVTVVASSGDSGFGLNGTLGGTQFPASLPSVTAVGGTRLVPQAHSKRGWSETAWTGGGSGCSAYFTKPAWQPGANCHMRTVADVAAVADPDTGVAVYDSALTPGGGWLVAGGTSVAAPLIAGVYGLAGNGATVNGAQRVYRDPSGLNDITSGSNGDCGSTRNYLCDARKGYDAPTGMGTPHGVGAF